jgi:WD40 repeat protein
MDRSRRFRVVPLALTAALSLSGGCAKKAGEDSLVATFLTGDRRHLSAIRFLPDGDHLMTAGLDPVIRVWDWRTAHQEYAWDNQVSADSLSVDAAGDRVLVGNDDGTLSLWDLRARSLVRRWRAHAGAIHGVAFSPDSRLCASGSDDGTVKLWRIPSGEPVRTLLGHSGWVGQVSFSADGAHLVSASADGTLRTWDVESGTSERVFRGHSTWVRSATFVGDGNEIVSGGYDQDVRLWDARTGAPTRTMRGPSIIYEIRAARDGRWGITVDEASSVSLWDLKSGSSVHRFSTRWRLGNSTSCGDVSPDGRWAAAGDWDDDVYVWDLRPAEAAGR